MNYNKKGQIAMETILIYGVALVVIGLAIGGLVYFGVLDTKSLLPQKCEMAGVEMSCEGFTIDGKGNIALEFENNFGRNIEISEFSLVGKDDYEGVRCDITTKSPIDVSDKGEFALLTGVTAPTLPNDADGKPVNGISDACGGDLASRIAAATEGSKVQFTVQVMYKTGAINLYHTGTVVGEILDLS